MNQEEKDPSLLLQLRALTRSHCGGPASAQRLAEQQAAALQALLGERPHEQAAAFRRALPGVRVVLADIPTSGLSIWDGRQWVIAVNRSEPATRRRFTVLHEYKHVIDHPQVDWLYHERCGVSATAQAEQAADYFAGCVLVPSRELRRLWTRGVRDVGRLAAIFDVSTPAVRVRIAQPGLTRDVTTTRALPAHSSRSRCTAEVHAT